MSTPMLSLEAKNSTNYQTNSLLKQSLTPSSSTYYKLNQYGMQKAYKKFQFYDRSQLNMQRFYGTLSKLKRNESDITLWRQDSLDKSQHNTQISQIDITNSTAPTTTALLQQQLQQQWQLEHQKQNSKFNHESIDFTNTILNQQQMQQQQKIRKISTVNLTGTNFITPKLNNRYNSVDRQQQKMHNVYGEEIKVITVDVNQNANNRRSLFNQTKTMFKTKQSLNNLEQQNRYDAMSSTNYMKKSVSQKVFFNPPKKIKDILLDKNLSMEEQHQQILKKYSNFKNSTIIQSEESQESLQNEPKQQTQELQQELSLPAIIKKPSIQQDENYASQQILKSRLNKQQSTNNITNYTQQQKDYAEVIQSQNQSTYINNQNETIVNNNNNARFLQKVKYQQSMKLVNIDSQMLINNNNDNSDYQLDQLNQQPLTQRYIKVEALDESKDQISKQKLLLSTGKNLKLMNYQQNNSSNTLNYDSQSNILKSVQIDELITCDSNSSRSKLLRKIQDQLQNKINKYQKTNNSISSNQLQYTVQGAQAKDLKNMFNTQDTLIGPYQNQSLKFRHNSLKNKLRKISQPCRQNDQGGSNKKGDKDLTLALDEIINSSKNLEIKNKANENNNNNLSLIMEQNRSMRNSPKKGSVNQQNDKNNEINQKTDLLKSPEIEQQIFIKTLTQTFGQQMYQQESDIIFQIFQKTPLERTDEEDERAINYLYSISIFKEFPKNLIKEVSRKFTTLTLQKDELIKYKSDDTYQIILKGKILKLDPSQNFKQSKILLNTVFDPTEYLNNKSILMVKQTSNLLSICKKDLAKCIKIASLRQGADDDVQFLTKINFFRKLNKDVLQQLCNLLVPRLFEEGKKIYDIGDVSEEMFIVRSGIVSEQVEVKIDNSLQQLEISSKNKYFEFAQHTTGGWFGQSEMMQNSTRKSRVIAQQNTLLLCIRRYELQKIIGEEFYELFKMHIFVHEDLKNRMVNVSKDKAESLGQLKKYKHFSEK